MSGAEGSGGEPGAGPTGQAAPPPWERWQQVADRALALAVTLDLPPTDDPNRLVERALLAAGSGIPLPAARPDSDRVRAYLQAIAIVPLLTSDEERAIITRLSTGTDEDRSVATRELALGHLRLVVSVARRYEGRGVPVSELIPVGNRALLEAVARYTGLRPADTSGLRPGFRFSSYATWFIRHALVAAIERAATGSTVTQPGPTER